jgi:hypothetical protein
MVFRSGSEGRRQDPTATKHKGLDLSSAQPRSALCWDAVPSHRFVIRASRQITESQIVSPPPSAKRSMYICVQLTLLSVQSDTACLSALRSCQAGNPHRYNKTATLVQLFGQIEPSISCR